MLWASRCLMAGCFDIRLMLHYDMAVVLYMIYVGVVTDVFV